MAESRNSPIEADAVIVGAGPVGLFQVFELGLLDVHAHVIDSLGCAGGQCVELYPDKPIYDIPAIPMCTGQELTHKLLQQIAPFKPTFHFSQEVTTVQSQLGGRFLVETSKGTRFLTKTLFLAAGVGAFQPRTLQVDGLEKFEGTQLFYQVSDPAQHASKNLVIVGDADQALDWAMKFCTGNPDTHPNKAQSVTLLHRRNSFKAMPETVERMRALCESNRMRFVVGQITGVETLQDRLTGVTVTGADGISFLLPLDAILVFLGLSPKLGPIAGWGLDIERKQVKVDTERFSTSVPGIFAVGDINVYPGKKKLILCGFHECTLAAFGALPIIHPTHKVLLQYTTTSPKLHQLLGVGSAAQQTL